MIVNRFYRERLNYMKTNSIYFPQNINEFYYYCRLLKDCFKRPITYVEIGSRQGGSLYMASRFIKNQSKIISIDLPNAAWGFEGTEEELYNIIKLLRVDGFNAHVILADSQKSETKIKLIQLIDNEGIDVLFIDADHTFKGVQNDWNMYFDLVNNNGLIVFHDIIKNESNHGVEVYKLWETIKLGFPHQEFVFEYGIGVIHKKAIE